MKTKVNILYKKKVRIKAPLAHVYMSSWCCALPVLLIPPYCAPKWLLPPLFTSDQQLDGG
ncbi:hypothetical protein K450DRAFT_232364 [Umbelopsis ramanniana AG]|uniref:Uncharacterized protein n=1 Tax=Umbelopsis ramanniana AG TaxID=1314678 RepID=A0AAD5EC81_UMBRA|nr:uncharacterized protein K450DRAFT_232364 [Umbelopsis ramanniana AG]KAI8581293.1 hypothetical protein K450DRAFT_232364 [Umbelopsis ramanniana AG]